MSPLGAQDVGSILLLGMRVLDDLAVLWIDEDSGLAAGERRGERHSEHLQHQQRRKQRQRLEGRQIHRVEGQRRHRRLLFL